MDTFTIPSAGEPRLPVDELHQVLTHIAHEIESLHGYMQALDEKLAHVLDEGHSASAEYLSIKQAAALAGLSPTKIRREIKAGRLPASNAGSTLRPLYRIQKTELEAWLRAKKGETDVPPRVPMHKRKLKSRYFGDI